MKTSKSFSTVSYNSDEFLTVKLTELIRRGQIDFFAYVNHYPEEDEGKAHKHLFIIPSGRIDTAQVVEYLEEIDVKKPDKPLKCMPCRSSKFDDWYYYALHDVRYLASKGQARAYHYRLDDIITSDRDYLVELTHLIDNSKLQRINILKEAAEDGIAFESLVQSGQIPIQQINQYFTAYNMIAAVSTYRNKRTTHTPKEDED